MSDVVIPDYPAIRDVIQRYLRTVPGVRAVLTYEPSSVQTHPLIYTLLDTVPNKWGTDKLEYRTYGMIHRLAVPWGASNERAEDQIGQLLDPIFNALRRATWSRLDNLVPTGMLTIDTVRAGFLPIGGALCRVVDYPTSVLITGGITRHQQ